jgi:hypothetical protein
MVQIVRADRRDVQLHPVAAGLQIDRETHPEREVIIFISFVKKNNIFLI